MEFTVGLTVLLAVVAGVAAAAPDAAAEASYDVSYLWASDVDRVQDYRRKVGYILGPSVSKKLKVVRKEDRYGLIYMRSGDSAGAARVAKSHTRLLRRAGLDDAAPMREEEWNVLGSGGNPVKESTDHAPKKSTALEYNPAEVRDLELAVEDYIKQLRRQGRLTDDERTGWSVYDFTTGEKLVAINEDDQFQAASLIKPFIAAAFFHRVKTGDFIYGPKSRRHMMRMIHWSDNRSTNWVMRQIGGPAAVQRILKTQYPAIFQDIRLVEYIPAGGKTYRNKASIHDYSRFLYALWNNRIQGASEIKRLMALPGSNRIATGASDIPKGTKVYNKTGSTAHLCGDIGILIVKGPDGKNYPYAVVAVIEKRHKAKNYTAWIRSRGGIIGNVSNIVYKGIARRHEFATKISGNVQ